MSQNRSSSEARAIKLLGDGLGPEQVAAAVGLSVGRISQLVSDGEISKEILDKRYSNLSKHNERDAKYDEVEDDLLQRFAAVTPMMMRPLEILKGLKEINSMKRRGSSAPTHLVNQQTVLNLHIPISVVNRFTGEGNGIKVNPMNQVVQAGGQELVTIQSGNMQGLLTAQKVKDGEFTDVQINPSKPLPAPAGANS